MDCNTSGESEPTKLDNKGVDVSKPVPEISNTEPYKPEPAKRTNSANKRPSSGIVNTKPVNNVAPQISITSNATSETEVVSKEDVNNEKKDEKNNEDSKKLHLGNDLDTLDPGGKTDDEITSNVSDNESNAKEGKDNWARHYHVMQGLTNEQLREKLTRWVEELKEMETHDNKKCQAIIKAIGSVYVKYYIPAIRQVIYDALLACEFPIVAFDMLTEFNTAGVFKDDATWFPVYWLLKSIWNYTDCSRKMSQGFAEAGLVKMLIENIKHKEYMDNLEDSKNVTYLIKSSLSILHNMSKCDEIKTIYRDNGAIEALQPYSKSDNEFYKAVGMLILTAILDEDEKTELDASDAIPFIVNCIRRAIKTKQRRNRGFTPTELSQGLARMAVNKENNSTIIAEGSLRLFVNMLDSSRPHEQEAAAKALWTIGFDEESREKIKAEPGCVAALERLSDTSKRGVKKCVNGALWVILEKTPPTDVEGKTISREHIFISYNWSDQEMCKNIKTRLQSEGYRVWMDIDEMSGSTLEAMALAVEHAAVVLVCASEKYKHSPNCRTEAEYSHTLHKPVLPLMMQRHYKPDGWLGMVLGAKFYVNFDGKYEFDKAYEMLVKELNGKGKGEVATHVPATATVAPMSSGNTISSITAGTVLSWDQENVQQWLEEQKLEKLKPKFESYNGAMLMALRDMRKEVPEFLYKNLQSELHLNFQDVLLIANALKRLPGS